MFIQLYYTYFVPLVFIPWCSSFADMENPMASALAKPVILAAK